MGAGWGAPRVPVSWGDRQPWCKKEGVVGRSPSPAWPEGPNSQAWRGQDPPWTGASPDLVRCVQVQKARPQPRDPRPSCGREGV